MELKHDEPPEGGDGKVIPWYLAERRLTRHTQRASKARRKEKRSVLLSTASPHGERVDTNHRIENRLEITASFTRYCVTEASVTEKGAATSEEVERAGKVRTRGEQ